MSEFFDRSLPRPAFDALISHDGQRLAAAVGVLHVAGQEPDYGALRKRMENVAEVEGGRDARAEVVDAAARRLHQYSAVDELPRVLGLLEWVSARAYGRTKKGATPCAIQ